MERFEHILKTGDIDNFAEMFSIFYPLLYAFSRKYIPDPDDAKDIIQNVFINIWEKRNEVAIHTSLKSYLLKMVSNACLNEIKRRNVKSNLETRLRIKLLEEEKVRIEQESYTYELLNHEKLTKLKQAIEKLPVSCKEIFKKSRFGEMKNREIAEELNISVRTVETQIYRALKVLRSNLQDSNE
jgi:RNA polymerase sigma-70 factor (ECF subfamily)